MPRSSAERVIHNLLDQVDELKRRKRALIARECSARADETVVFFDCDDCLYQNDWQTADKITASISSYAKNNLSLPEGVRTYDLYRKHGTTAKGLLAEGYLDEAGVQKFLSKAHDIDYSDIREDPELRRVVERVAKPRWLFTAAPREHAERCLGRVGIPVALFDGIIDTHVCRFETKHSPASFRTAMQSAGVTHPAACILCDDSVKNIEAAHAFGWRTVLVGKIGRDDKQPIHCPAADVHIGSMHELPAAMPELFVG